MFSNDQNIETIQQLFIEVKNICPFRKSTPNWRLLKIDRAAFYPNFGIDSHYFKHGGSVLYVFYICLLAGPCFWEYHGELCTDNHRHHTADYCSYHFPQETYYQSDGQIHCQPIHSGTVKRRKA